MFQQIVFFMVVTLLGVATLTFADEHQVSKPKATRPAGRPTESAPPSRGPAVLSQDEAAADAKAAEDDVITEFGEAVQELMQFNNMNSQSSSADNMPGELSSPHGGASPNLFSMPQ
jgi:hypothetical protein